MKLERVKDVMNASFATTSSFLTISPWTLVLPSAPYNLNKPAALTFDERNLDAISIACKTIESCPFLFLKKIKEKKSSFFLQLLQMFLISFK